MSVRPSSSILGAVIAGVVLYAAATESFTDLTAYLNAVGMIIVIGGTLAVSIIAFSLSETKRFLIAYASVFIRMGLSRVESINEVLALAVGARTNPNHLKNALPHIKNPFTKESVELLLDGLPFNEVRSILRQNVTESTNRDLSDAAMIRVISKFPPAFGLMGTLIGLISMLQSMGGGDVMKNIGPQMSIALVATFYGIMVANLFLIPIADSLEKQAEHNSKTRQILASGILMIIEETPVILMRERLKAYLSTEEKASIRMITSQASNVSSINAEPNVMAGGGR